MDTSHADLFGNQTAVDERAAAPDLGSIRFQELFRFEDVELGLSLFSWRGPADRLTYIAVTLVLYSLTCLIGVGLCVGLASLDTPLPPEDVPAFLASARVPAPVAWRILGTGFVGLVAVFLGSVAISVRRLHDAGRSGLLVLGFSVLPWVLPDPP